MWIQFGIYTGLSLFCFRMVKNFVLNSISNDQITVRYVTWTDLRVNLKKGLLGQLFFFG